MDPFPPPPPPPSPAYYYDQECFKNIEDEIDEISQMRRTPPPTVDPLGEDADYLEMSEMDVIILGMQSYLVSRGFSNRDITSINKCVVNFCKRHNIKTMDEYIAARRYVVVKKAIWIYELPINYNNIQ